jgi:CheY-like chemotaxis protein
MRLLVFCSLKGGFMLKKVLIVEDYSDTREFMKLLVESFGHKPLEAVNGIEAVLSVRQEIPDLILMDIALPDIDGLTATRLIREYLRELKIPIIAVTASGKACYQEAIEAGCNEVIGKPIDFDSFEPVLNHYLGH